MYAIIGAGGKQYRVSRGDLLKIDLLPPETKKVTFSEVYLVANGQEAAVGDPLVAGAKVTATVVGTGRHPKVLVFKMKRRKQYKRTIGHRQHFTSVRIEVIDSGGTVKPLDGEDTVGRRKTGTRKAAPKKKAAASGKPRAARKKATTRKTAAAKARTGTKKAGGRRPAAPKTTARKKTKKKTKKKSTGRRS